MRNIIGFVLMYKEKQLNSAFFCVDITKSENMEFHSSLKGFIIQDNLIADNLLKVYSDRFPNLEFKLVACTGETDEFL